MKKILGIALLVFSLNCFADTGLGIAVGVATGIAASNAGNDADYQIKIEICKTKNNNLEIQKCLTNLQKEKNYSDLIILLILSGVLAMLLLLLFFL